MHWCSIVYKSAFSSYIKRIYKLISSSFQNNDKRYKCSWWSSEQYVVLCERKIIKLYQRSAKELWNWLLQMYQKIILILFILNGELVCAASVADSWILFAKALKDSWSHCPVKVSLLLINSSQSVSNKTLF